MRTKDFVFRLLLSVLGIMAFFYPANAAKTSIELFTTNTKISIAPGESVTYSIDVINHDSTTHVCDLNLTGIPSTWIYHLKSENYNIRQIAVQGKQKETVKLQIDVPLRVNKGNYPITVKAGDTKLPLVINISKQGSYKTELTCDQANMQGHADASFSFRTTLKNQTGDQQLYSLISGAPRGWQVIFKPNYNQATSVEIEANATKDITIEVKPPHFVGAGTYTIPVKAVSGASEAAIDLEVVITGTYSIKLDTPTGLLSTSITAGNEQELDLVVANNGSAKLSNVTLSASKPSGWDVVFEPSEIKEIAPGEQVTARATIRADKKAIAGDYVVNINAKVAEASSDVALRVAVKTPAVWGWIGILIILSVVGCIVFLFRKYGRR